jgi:hypothetical protein
MAINVKKLKRVIQGNEPLKVLNSGDKKPAFRQNGYGLTFDSANSDYLSFDEVTINEGDSVECTINRLNRSNDVFFFGNSSSTSNFLTLFTSGGTQLRDSLGNNYNGSPNLDIIGEYKATVRLEGGNYVVTINGVEVINSLALAPIAFNQINRRAVNSAYISDIEVKNFIINTETFNLSDSRGTTTTGSEGTIATINTSNAGGVQYLDSTVWNKKSFALEFDAANSEYLLLDSPIVFSVGESMSFEVQCSEDSMFIMGNSSSDVFFAYNRISTWFYLKDNDGNALTFVNPVVDLSNRSIVKIENNDTTYSVYLNDVLVSTETRVSGLATFNQMNERRSDGVFADAIIYNFTINSEQFNLTEGLGNKIYGSNGTIGTINTDALGGIVGSDSNELVLDGVNSDYLEISKSVVIGDTIAITFVLNQYLFGDHIMSNLSSSFRVYLDDPSLILTGCNMVSLLADGVDVTSNQDIPNRIGQTLVLTVTSSVNADIEAIGRREVGSDRYLNGTLYNFSISGEVFNFIEGKGTAITGSLGTTATINTSHADGSEYVDYQIWDNPIMTPAYRNNYGQWLKNGNILKFDRANSDYLELPSVITLQDGSSFKWEGSFINEGAYIPLLFGTSTTYLDIAEGLIRLRINGTDDFINDVAITENTTHAIELFKTGNDYSVSFDGGTPIFMVTTVDDFFVIDIGKRVGIYGNITVNTLELNTEQFLFREGQGITTEGSLGTTATINTSNAGGVQYINEQVWNIDSNKYIDYE